MALGTPAVLGYDGTNTTSAATGSFTPAANATLVVFGFIRRNSNGDPGAIGITDSLGLTWTQQFLSSRVSSGTADYVASIWTAPVGGSPASMTVTVSGASAHFTAQVTAEITGTLGTLTNCAAGVDASAAGDPTVTLSGTPAAASVLFGAAWCMGGSNVVTEPASWTELLDSNETSSRLEAAYAAGTVGAGAHLWASSNFSSVAAIIEITESSSISGTLAATLGAVSVSAAGALAIEGAASQALAAVTAAATAGLAIDGAAAATLDAVTLSAAGSGAPPIEGSASIPLDAVTASGVASLAIAGSAALSLDAIEAAGQGALPIAGEASATLAAIALAASGSAQDDEEAPSGGHWLPPPQGGAERRVKADRERAERIRKSIERAYAVARGLPVEDDAAEVAVSLAKAAAPYTEALPGGRLAIDAARLAENEADMRRLERLVEQLAAASAALEQEEEDALMVLLLS